MNEILSFMKEKLQDEYSEDIQIGYREVFEIEAPTILIIPGTEKRTINNLGNSQEKVIEFRIDIYKDYDTEYPTEGLEFTEKLVDYLVKNSSEKIVTFQEVKISSTIEEKEEIFVGTVYLKILKRR